MIKVSKTPCWYTVYKVRSQMYGDPLLSVLAKSAVEAVEFARDNCGPGTYKAVLL